MSLGANLLSIFVPSYFFTVTMLPQMESNHLLQIQNLPHYRYAIGQVCGG